MGIQNQLLKYYKNEVSEAIEVQKWGKMRESELVSGGYGNEMKEDVERGKEVEREEKCKDKMGRM